ncbi:MAG: NAD-dependent DNA ligase LigA, partial [Verrucomicrobiales bacterium]|nr:NAD-dependent DNA ligase LigA [Verrucomicrobiales bacterium]
MKPGVADLERYDWLAAEIGRHDTAYYTLARPTISDFEYDRLYRELRDFEERFPDCRRPDSPTLRVGAPPLTEFRQVAHRQRMESLDNTYSFAELGEFFTRVQKGLGGGPVSYMVEPKVDGVAVSARYERGALTLGLTRGDGSRGDDITENLKTIRQLPLTVTGAPEVLEVRGEVYLTHSAFARLNQEREEQGLDLFANARNATAGTLKLLDSREVAKRRLSLVVYAVGEVAGLEFASQEEVLARLSAFGFNVPEWHARAADGEEVLTAIGVLEKLRKNFAYPTDGAVVKVSEFSARAELGSTAKAPRWAVAYKFAPERAETRLKGVTFQVGRTGVITPVAELETVQLSGTKVSRATLHNFHEIQRKDIRLGDIVLVEKAGEIIPAVVGVNLERRDFMVEPIEPPQLCPCCGSADLTWDGVFYKCVNPDCAAQINRRLAHFAHRGAMDIEGLGEASVALLMREGLIKRLDDIYRLKAGQLAGLERMGEKSARNLITGIEASKRQPLWRLIFGLGIDQVGSGLARKLEKRFGSLERLAAATREELEAVDDVGEKVAESVGQYFARPESRRLLAALKELGVSAEAASADSETALGGKIFVITGTLSKPRAYFEERIRALGGEVSGSVGKKTSYLLAGAGGGAKL